MVSVSPDVDREGGTALYGCLRAVGKERLLTEASNTGGSITGFGNVQLAGRFVALDSFYEDKYFNCGSSVSVYDLGTGKPGRIYSAGCSGYPIGTPSGIDSLALSSSGASAWRVTSIPVAPLALTGVSCPTASLCVAVDGAGQVGTATAPTGGRDAWTFDRVDGQNPLTAVSCPTAGLCVAVDHQGQVLTSTNPTGGASAWTASQIDGTTPLAAVSCPSASLCVAADQAGNVVTSTDPTGGASAWKIAHVDPSFLGMITGISCPSTTLCVAADDGNVVTSTDPTGGASTWTVTHVDSNYDGLRSISCASPSLCVAGDGEGDLVTSTDPTAGASAWKIVSLEPPQTSDLVGGVACPSTSLCVAVDGRGNAITSTDPTAGAASWKVSRIDAGDLRGNQASLAAVSCATPSLCVAVDDLGSTFTTTDPTGGASAWSNALIDAPPACAASPCAVEELYAHDDHGTQLIDSTSPGAGHSIANVSIIDTNTLTWTHDGTPRQATP